MCVSSGCTYDVYMEMLIAVALKAAKATKDAKTPKTSRSD